MRVFVTGATGFIGRPVVKELLGADHEVVGLARSSSSEDALIAAGAKAHRGSLEDAESLRRAASTADAAIHLAFFHEFAHASLATRMRVIFGGKPSGIVMRFLGAAANTDRIAIETIGGALKGSDPAFVAACGTMSLEPGRIATEDDAPNPKAPGAARVSEAAVLGLVKRGVRASALRLPPIVHGEDDRAGFVPRLIEIARKKNQSGYVGDGLNRWGAVHRLDAARLFRLALENGTAGARYHGVAEEGTPTRDIATAIGRRLGVPIVSKTSKEAAAQFSWLATFLATDNPCASDLTRGRLGWHPAHADLQTDLNDIYFKT